MLILLLWSSPASVSGFVTSSARDVVETTETPIDVVETTALSDVGSRVRDAEEEVGYTPSGLGTKCPGHGKMVRHVMIWSDTMVLP